MNANIKARSTLATYPDGTKVLVGEIEIDCDACGSGVIAIPGHHMRAIRNILMEWCDEHPEIVGMDANIHRISETRMAGTAPSRPEDN